jgi:hypothetical protein
LLQSKAGTQETLAMDKNEGVQKLSDHLFEMKTTICKGLRQTEELVESFKKVLPANNECLGYEEGKHCFVYVLLYYGMKVVFYMFSCRLYSSVGYCRRSYEDTYNATPHSRCSSRCRGKKCEINLHFMKMFDEFTYFLEDERTFAISKMVNKMKLKKYFIFLCFEFDEIKFKQSQFLLK